METPNSKHYITLSRVLYSSNYLNVDWIGGYEVTQKYL